MLLGRRLADIVSLIGPTLRPIPENSYLAVQPKPTSERFRDRSIGTRS